MTDRPTTAQTWIAGVLLVGAAAYIGFLLPHGETAVRASSEPSHSRPAPTSPKQTAFAPPQGEIPDTDFGKMAKLGEAIFRDTQANATDFVGNSLQCENCHLDAGRLANSAPLWAAYVAFPAYRSKNGHVNTFQERLQGCFRFSMNGKAPPLGSKTLVALESYAYYLAKGAPTGANLPGRGYPKLKKSPISIASMAGRCTPKSALCAMARMGRGKPPRTARSYFRRSGGLGRTIGEPA